MKLDTLRRQIESLNRELSELTGQPEVELSFQSGEADQDTLYLYGIMGGKDVGKTTLINQLAGSRISLDTNILDEGTKIAVAYVHEKDKPYLKKRLMGEVGQRVRYVSHQRNELRNVVLVDFPDFDSRFLTHREDVHNLARHLQGILWVVTPRKYGDHEFIQRLTSIAQSNENYYIILNKMDQLEEVVPISTVREKVLTLLEKECHKRRINSPSPDRLMVVSAHSPKKYEYPELHARLIRRHSLDEILRAKAENIQTEFEKNIQRLRDEYQIDEKIEAMENLFDRLHSMVDEQFTADYFETVLQRMQLMEQIQRRISTQLFFQRVEGWPLLRSLCYPLAGIVSAIGRRLTASSMAMHEGIETSRDLLRYHGETVSSRMQKIHLTLQEQLPPHLGPVQTIPNYSESIDREFQHLMQTYEDRVVGKIRSTIKPPGKARKFAVYFPLVWFPFLQPMLLNISEMEGSIISFKFMGEVIYTFITLLGARSLLVSVIFLIVFYLIWLVLLYANGARYVLREGQEEFRETWYEEFLPWIVNELSRPFQEVRSRWMDIRLRLESIREEIREEIQRIQRMN